MRRVTVCRVPSAMAEKTGPRDQSRLGPSRARHMDRRSLCRRRKRSKDVREPLLVPLSPPRPIVGAGICCRSLFLTYAKWRASPSIFYALKGDVRTSVIMSGARSMLSFVTSQAIALSQVKAKEGEPTNVSQDQVGAVPHRPKSLFKRLLEALVEPRMRKTGCEAKVHRRLDPRQHQ